MKALLKQISLLLCSGLIIPICFFTFSRQSNNFPVNFTDSIYAPTPIFVQLTEKLLPALKFLR